MISRTRIVALVIGLAVTATASAQQQVMTPAQQERMRRVMDEAYGQALVEQAKVKAQPRTGLSIDEVRAMKGADPAAIANRYREMGAGIRKEGQDLLIFVSTSMPQKALQMLGEQAKQTGAVLVLRGLKRPLGKPGALEETLKAMAPVSATGANIQIDPEAFLRYQVTAVPTFVIAATEESCAADACPVQSYALAGDTTLEYALETWSGRGGVVGRLADNYLARLKKGQQ